MKILFVLISFLFLTDCMSSHEVIFHNVDQIHDDRACYNTCQLHLSDNLCSSFELMIDKWNYSNCICYYKGCSTLVK